MSHHEVHRHSFTRSALIALAAGAVVALSPLAQAQPAAAGRGPVSFAAIDTDHDGQVTALEFAQHRASRQAARAAEGRPMRGAATAPSFESLDRNGNGTLSPDELAAGQQARFAARGYGQGGRGCRTQ